MSTISKRSLYGLFFGVLFISSESHAVICKTADESLAQQCAPDLEGKTERIFAHSGSHAWKEYATAQHVPRRDGTDSDTTIAVKTSSSGRHFVRTVEYGEDSAHYQSSCYDRGGVLRSLHYELRTAWGWGYEDERSFNARGRLIRRSTRFFDTKSNEQIERPSQADDVPEFLKPTVYKNFEALPIAKARTQETYATPQ